MGVRPFFTFKRCFPSDIFFFKKIDLSLFSTSFFAKYLHVVEDCPGQGHLCHTDTFLVLFHTLLRFFPEEEIIEKSISVLADLGGSVRCASICCSEGPEFDPRCVWQHSFMEIDHEIFLTVILSLSLIQERQLSVSSKRMCTSTC